MHELNCYAPGLFVGAHVLGSVDDSAAELDVGASLLLVAQVGEVTDAGAPTECELVWGDHKLTIFVYLTGLRHKTMQESQDPVNFG